MGIEDESNLSQPDFCEKTKKRNMSTTRVEMSRTEVIHYTFEIPTYVAEWFKDNSKDYPYAYPEILNHRRQDYWELLWGEGGEKIIKIKKGEMEQVGSNVDEVEYTVIDEAAELREKAEAYRRNAEYCETKAKLLEERE